MKKELQANKMKEWERYGEIFSELCNFFWYVTHPEWPRDDFRHTSSVCRKLAGEIMDIFVKNGIEGPKISPHEWLLRIPQEKRAGALRRLLAMQARDRAEI